MFFKQYRVNSVQFISSKHETEWAESEKLTLEKFGTELKRNTYEREQFQEFKQNGQPYEDTFIQRLIAKVQG